MIHLSSKTRTTQIEKCGKLLLESSLYLHAQFSCQDFIAHFPKRIVKIVKWIYSRKETSIILHAVGQDLVAGLGKGIPILPRSNPLSIFDSFSVLWLAQFTDSAVTNHTKLNIGIFPTAPLLR